MAIDIQQIIASALKEVAANNEGWAAEAARLFEEEGSEQAEEVEEDPMTTPPIEAEGDTDGEEELFVPATENLSEIDVYTFVDLMNRFRSAPSFSEGDRRDNFDLYWDSLQPSEQQFLYLAMLGFTQVALKGASATDATHPHNYSLEARAAAQDVAAEDAGAEPFDPTDGIPEDRRAPIVVGESKPARRRLPINPTDDRMD